MPSDARRRYPVPFGRGMDRETGIMLADPSSFEDLRNVYLHDGKATIRGGFTSALTFSEVDAIVAGHALKSERVGIVVGYNSADETVHVYRVASDGRSGEHLGIWTHDRGGWGSEAPRIIMAESYGRVFMAHDEPQITARAQTLHYDPLFSGGALTLLTADLDGTGAKPVRFRGVVRHLNYLFGWGFGSDSENRPELVRVSKPGEPDLFEANSYFIVGDRRDPVIRCVTAGRELLTFKETETYAIVGSGKRDFGEILVDPLYGIAGSRLAVNVSGIVLGWSGEGPRIWAGATQSEDLETPLDTDGWEPSDLVEEGAVEDAFAHYIPGARVVAFVFGRRVYALTVRRPGDWKWSYWELGFTPRCAFTLYPGNEITTAPTGHPEWASTTPAGTYADLVVDNVDQDGDEVLEIWLKPAGGVWGLMKSLAVSSTDQQTVRCGDTVGDELTPGTDYEGAVRYRRGTLYDDPYRSSDPSTWPVVSQGSFATTIDPPTIEGCSWARTNSTTEGITLTITPAPGQEGREIEVYRDGVLVHTASSPTTDGLFTWEDVGITGETDHDYQVKTLGASTNSPLSDPHTCWAGPQSPPTVDWLSAFCTSNIGEGKYEIRWVDGDADLKTETWDSYDSSTDTNGAFPTTLRGTENATNDPSAPGNQHFASGVIGNDLSQKTITVGVRHKSTVDTVDDFSKFSSREVVFPACG